MLEFFGALSLVQQAASPVKVNAAPGEAGLFLENMIHRYPVAEACVRLVGARENVVALVLIDDGSRKRLGADAFHGVPGIVR